MSRALLITGATGKQGSAVIDALLARRKSADFTILALTRDAQSASARRLASKSPSIKLVQGDLDDVPGLFATAKKAASPSSIWGVFSVQATFKSEQEVAQGTALVDEALKAGVSHFVYSSVERGGDARSWDNPTQVPHFRTKQKIEQHLRSAAAAKTTNGTQRMGWTILRPTIFMDNLVPGFASKVFMTALRDTMKDKPLQWVATSDIGVFAAHAFEDPASWDGKAAGLAGDSLTFAELDQVFQNVTGEPVGTTWSLLGKALKKGVKEMGSMIDWFAEEGYKADLEGCRSTNPEMMGLEEWLRTKSKFVRRF